MCYGLRGMCYVVCAVLYVVCAMCDVLCPMCWVEHNVRKATYAIKITLLNHVLEFVTVPHISLEH